MSRGPFLLSLLLCATALASASEGETPRSAEYCGDCHRAIEAGWKQSAHSHAVESRLFQDALKYAEADFGSQARRVCLGCHSPTAVETGDLALVRKVSWEGITCDYCHSIRNVTLNGPNPKALVEYTGVKSGPWKDVQSPAHGTVYSPVHTSALICVTCHEYRNSQGFEVLTTYTEWKDGPYAAKNEDCQSCHMYRVEGDVVDPRVKRTAEVGINLHQMPGSHSLDQLNKAIRANLSTAHKGGELRVEVSVTNQGAGHMVPTGSPLRKLILEVRANPFKGPTQHAERVFQRVVADASGKVLDREDLAFVKAAKVLSDTRLAPGETKKETFTFKVPQGVRSQVEADFLYYYSPMATTRAQQEVKFLSLRRFVQ